MGLDYHLECLDCKARSIDVEFAIVFEYRVKSIPEDYQHLEQDWTRFLASHSGHRIALVDSKGNQTDPAKVTPAYVLGIE